MNVQNRDELYYSTYLQSVDYEMTGDGVPRFSARLGAPRDGERS